MRGLPKSRLFTLTTLLFINFLYFLTTTALAASNVQANIETRGVDENSPGNFISEIRKGEAGHTLVFGQIDIEASPVIIWSVMQDCKAQLHIIPDLKSCLILESAEDGAWDRREQKLSLGFPLPNVRSEFRSDYTPYERIKITRTGGDLSVLEGEWTLTPQTQNITRISYQAKMKSKLPVPTRFIRGAARKDMPLILKNLKREAESRMPR
jgi:hypothetical protein